MAAGTDAREGRNAGAASASAMPEHAQQNGLGYASTSGRDEVRYDVGSRVSCKASFDSQQHPAEILDRRRDAKSEVFYVHYLDCDKRLDEWVTADRLSNSTPFALALQYAPSCTLPPGALIIVRFSRRDLLTPVGSDQKITRRLKRKFEDLHNAVSGVDELAKDHDHDAGQPEKRVKNIQMVELGRYEMDTWYFSPYPEPFAGQHKVYICEYTLKYFRKKKTLLRHLAKLDYRHPPGDEIYRSPLPPHNGSAPAYLPAAYASPQISVFEVDGKKSKVYCQNLCLLSKLFLDHKTLYYDVDPFLFYVLCEVDAAGHHIVGYFSKEKACQEHYNLACILTLPAHQRKGYGKFLIAFAYELSKREGKPGTPERPLSDLGQVSFRSYWTRVVLDVLRDNVRGDISIKDIQDRTMMTHDDIIYTLKYLNLLQYWKGTHFIAANPRLVEDHIRMVGTQRHIEVDPALLHWQPLNVPAATKAK